MTKVLRYSAALLFVTALSLLVGGSAAAQSTNNPRYRQFRDTAAASITTPAAGNVRLFFDSTGFYWKNSAGVVTPMGGADYSALTTGVVPQMGATELEDSKMTASGANGGTWTLYDDTATTGVTQFLVKEGAGQGFTVPFAVKGNLGNNLLFLSAQTAGTYLAAGGFRHVSDTDHYFALLAGQLYLDTDNPINSALGGPGIWFRDNIYSTPATAIVNESGGVIGLKSTTNNSRLNIYGAYTDTSNYERLSLYYDSGFTGFAIDTSAAGTGSIRHLKIGTSNGLYLYAGGDINTLAGPYGTVTTGSFTTDASSFYSGVDVVLSLGRPTHRWRNAYIGHSVQSGDEVTLAADNTVSPVTQVSCATADSVVAGYVSYTVSVADTTNHLVQTETGNVPFLLINENGTVTATVGTVFGQVIDSAGGAAITTTWSTAVTGTDTMIRATVDYDTATLTGTVVKTITSRVYVNSGTATVTPQ